MPGAYCLRCQCQVILQPDGRSCSNCNTVIIDPVPADKLITPQGRRDLPSEVNPHIHADQARAAGAAVELPVPASTFDIDAQEPPDQAPILDDHANPIDPPPSEET